MPRFDLFSKRQFDAAKAGQTEVYQYDTVTSAFRRQLLNIAATAFGSDKSFNRGSHAWTTNQNWIWIENTYSHEKGISPIGGKDHTPIAIRTTFMGMDANDAIDMTELIGYKINLIDEQRKLAYGTRDDTPISLIDEVNYRLREAGMGYQFENGGLTRVDSQLLHSEVVKPALTLLSKSGFEGAQQEFLKAHAHYRAGQTKEAVAMAANALESTFKAIFSSKGWTYPKGARISDLVKIAKANSLWPDYLDNSFDQLIATLQSGLPKIRDNDASHGQGATPKLVPPYLAAYALHLSASKIVFLVAAAEEIS